MMPRMMVVEMTREEYEAFTVQQKAVVLEALEEGLGKARTLKAVEKALSETLPKVRAILKADPKAKVPAYIFKG